MKNKIRQFAPPGFELGDYIKESIDFLRQHEPPEGYFVGFSGGKDSITTLELCRMASVKHTAYYSCTRIEPPEMYAFIKTYYKDVIWLFPKQSFYELIQKHQPPLMTQRWCCDLLKKKPSMDLPLKHRLMGIRSEESVRRAKRPRIDNYKNKHILYKPIFYWPEWAVWEFIETYNLSYPSIYDNGFSRIGCVTCPFMFGSSKAAQARLEKSMAFYPGLWKAFKNAVKRWFDKNSKYENQSFDQYWEAYLSGEKFIK